MAELPCCKTIGTGHTNVQGDSTDAQFRRRWRFFIIATAVLILMA
jgi:hypothetical protein